MGRVSGRGIAMAYDLSIFPSTYGEATDVDFDNSGGSFVSGPRLVAQKFVTFLLAQVGSVLHTAEYGTDFVYDARLGTLRNEAELQLAFASAAASLTDYQLEVEQTTDADSTVSEDELFQSAELNSFSYVDERIVLDLTVITRAGTAINISLPVMIVEL